MNSLRWLHLADLQVGDSESFGQHADVLLQDLALQIRKLPVNFVFATGDIAASGSSKQYTVAESFFHELGQSINLRSDRFYFVPGNHDSNRIDAGTNSSPGNSNNILQYNNFINNFAGPKQEFEQGRVYYVENLRFNQTRVAVLGFNSAMLDEQLVARYERELKEFGKQVEQAFTLASHADFRIALIHHPPSDISRYDGGQTSLLLSQNCNLVLHAHRHSPRNEWEVSLPSAEGPAIAIGGGSSFLGDIHPNIYQIGQVDLETGDGLLVRRTFDDKRKIWTSSGEEPFEFQLKLPTFEPTSSAAPATPVDEQQSPIEVRIPDVSKGSEEPSTEPPTAPATTIPALSSKPAAIQPGYISDQIEGTDQLGITNDVNAFAIVFTAQQVNPPLCLGLFGDWGSGKSFFMKKMRDRITWLADRARQAEIESQPSSFCSHVVQIDFNAWHYSDANLWASLASHIFKTLDSYLRIQGVTSTQRAELFRNLDVAKQKVEEASRAQYEAEQARETAQANLENVQEEAKKKEFKLSEVRDQIIETVQSKPEFISATESLYMAADELGLARTLTTIKQAPKLVNELYTLGGRLRAAFLWLTKRDANRLLRLGILLLLIVAVPFAPLVVNWILGLVSEQRLDEVGAAIAQITTFVVWLITWLVSLLRNVSASISKFETAQANVDRILDSADQSAKEKIISLEKEIGTLRKKEEAAQAVLQQAQRKYDDAQATLRQAETTVDGHSLADFIQEQALNESYRTQLGIISVVRQNLETLNQLLEKADKGGKLPRIDRIILYIDDLDRCPEDKVIEVLQAVHLLLAFRLFIVVVGVDSRWLLHSLERGYPALQSSSNTHAGWSEEELLAWESTPQNYLEKIFQIPYNLRPMEDDGFKILINSIMPLSSDLPEQTKTVGTDTSSVHSQSQGAPLEESKPQNKEGDITSVEQLSDEVEAIPTPPQADGPDDFNLNSDALRFEAIEQEFVHHLAAMIPTPRAAKRFINIYRLLRATIPSTELVVFVENGEFRAVMILLAILTGFPRLSPTIFRKLLILEDTYPWSNLISSIRPQQVSADHNGFYNGILTYFSAAEAVEWKRLYMNLNNLHQASILPESVGVYSRWVGQVARFSFRVGKITNNYVLSANVRIVEAGKAATGEYVEIRNIGDCAQIMTGWTLSDQAFHTFVFPIFLLNAGAIVRVWVGFGENTASDLYWGKKTSIWNDTGDIAALRDTTGSLVQEFPIKPVK